MSDVNWGCCPLVAQTLIVRAFIEQLVKERKAQSTIENYSRDLNDFLSAFPELPFSELLEADESCIADYVDWLWKREAQRGNGQPSDRSKIRYLTGSKLAPATIRRRLSALRSFYRWTIRLRHRRDPINPVREGVRGHERGLVSTPASIPWIPDDRQWKAILKYVLTTLSTRDQAIVLLAHDGALRREEIVQLRVDDIDWWMHTMTVRAEISKNKMPGRLCSLIQPGRVSKSTWRRTERSLSRPLEPRQLAPFFCRTRTGTLVSRSRNGPSKIFLIGSAMRFSSCHFSDILAHLYHKNCQQLA
jgi:integrase/recombinase XerD